MKAVGGAPACVQSIFLSEPKAQVKNLNENTFPFIFWCASTESPWGANTWATMLESLISWILYSALSLASLPFPCDLKCSGKQEDSPFTKIVEDNLRSSGSLLHRFLAYWKEHGMPCQTTSVWIFPRPWIGIHSCTFFLSPLNLFVHQKNSLG